MGSFLAKRDRVLGKTVNQSCPGFNLFDPSLLPGAPVSTSVKLMVFVRVLLARFFVLSLLLSWSGLRLVDAGNLDYEMGYQWWMASLSCGCEVTQEELVKRDTPPGA